MSDDPVGTKKTIVQIAETLSNMQHLFQYAHSKPHLSATESLSQLTMQFQTQSQFPSQAAYNQALHQQPQQHQHALNSNSGLQLPPGTNPSHFVSPAAAAHLNLPVNTTSASPATLNMSPAMHHLGGNPQQLQQQAPTSVGMVAQQSHQGTNTSAGTGSQGTSANASPNVSNKRRRPSGVKTEGDDGGGVEVNGAGGPGPGPKIKASPRTAKRQKGNG